MRRALLGAGLALLTLPGIAAYTHSLLWMCLGGALAGVIAAELDSRPRPKISPPPPSHPVWRNPRAPQ